jgi:hypothetical protein
MQLGFNKKTTRQFGKVAQEELGWGAVWGEIRNGMLLGNPTRGRGLCYSPRMNSQLRPNVSAATLASRALPNTG